MTDPASGCVHHICVRYPDAYDAALATRYPVVVVLDGDGLFPLLAPTPLFLHDDEQRPEAIIVGIAYSGFDPVINKRHVDFTAPVFAPPQAHTRLDLRVAVASGTRDTVERQRVASDWTTHWAAPLSNAPWRVTLITMRGGTHAAMTGESYRRAMLRLFRDRIVPQRAP
ncbi:alpha/beta hydrolase-fold protein [Pseudoxanthomonas japonensis]|uniref:alpha/beta hydrolase-fold protein n=1 Tax=Pseudoxanthomonas japonensis TaxID=69284 RepID=UPI00286B0B23|nr:alpha/beta hydrolase-fold protein [Pseudoxanthomonas japonensis]